MKEDGVLCFYPGLSLYSGECIAYASVELSFSCLSGRLPAGKIKIKAYYGPRADCLQFKTTINFNLVSVARRPSAALEFCLLY